MDNPVMTVTVCLLVSHCAALRPTLPTNTNTNPTQQQTCSSFGALLVQCRGCERWSPDELNTGLGLVRHHIMFVLVSGIPCCTE